MTMLCLLACFCLWLAVLSPPCSCIVLTSAVRSPMRGHCVTGCEVNLWFNVFFTITLLCAAAAPELLAPTCGYIPYKRLGDCRSLH